MYHCQLLQHVSQGSSWLTHINGSHVLLLQWTLTGQHNIDLQFHLCQLLVNPPDNPPQLSHNMSALNQLKSLQASHFLMSDAGMKRAGSWR